jgi:hypothetical protein
MFRRELLEVRKPLYNEDYPYAQDYELWQHLVLKGYRIHTLPETLMLYRKSKTQISTNKKSHQDRIFRVVHRDFIFNWMEAKGIIEKEDRHDLQLVLKKAGRAYKTLDRKDRDCLSKMIYVHYYSIGTKNKKYRLKYLVDSNFIIFQVRFILTLRLLFSKKKRRSRQSID